MFVKTIKLKKPNPIAIVLVLAAVLILIGIWVFGSGGKGIGNKYKLASNTERTKFLTDLGWQVSPNETDCKVVKVPSEFNKVYDVYNRLQKEQGFDLTKYKGKSVEIYTYDVYNYPNKSDNILAHLIVCDGTLIGGDVSSTEINGFMQGLMPINKGELKNSGTVQSQPKTKGADTSEKPSTTDVATTDTTTGSDANAPAETSTPTEPAVTTTSGAGDDAGFTFTTPQN